MVTKLVAVGAVKFSIGPFCAEFQRDHFRNDDDFGKWTIGVGQWTIGVGNWTIGIRKLTIGVGKSTDLGRNRPKRYIGQKNVRFGFDKNTDEKRHVLINRSFHEFIQGTFKCLVSMNRDLF